MLTPPVYQHWLSIARRHARRADEAADLLHNALLAAMRAGRRDLSEAENAAWFAGVIRNLALMDARSAVRRRHRETNQVQTGAPLAAPADELEAWLATVSSLPAGARSVAVLALHGLNRKEIANILELSDTAFRQRLTSIRKALDRDPAKPGELPQLRSTFRTQLEVGLLRRALLAVLQHEGDLGIHDPDGHLIVISKKNSQNRVSRQQH